MKKLFSPLIFLASLGAGGISLISFAYFQYVFPRVAGAKGLITVKEILHGSYPVPQEIFYISLEVIMAVFVIIHVVLTILLLRGLITFVRSREYKEEFLQNPLSNAGILAPFISIIMSMNVFIGSIRFFFPMISSNLQSVMFPALIGWSIIWILLMRMEIKLLHISFVNEFDVNKISFGWLLHPFALGMVTVTGTGIAAMSKNPSIAHTAAFMSLVSGAMGFFLLVVKLIAIFQSHFAASGLPEKQFLPSFLIVLPNITLFALSGFRLGHYAHVHLGFNTVGLSTFIIVFSFAFQTWYLFFGLTLLKSYIKNHFFTKEFYITQWGFVCPFVAFAILGSFTFKVFVPTLVLQVIIIFTLFFSVFLFFLLLKRQIACNGLFNQKIKCIY